MSGEENVQSITVALDKADKRIGTKDRPPISVDMQRRVEQAEIFARSGFFTDIKQVAQAVVKLMIAEELGIPSISAMTSIHVFGDTGKTNIQIGAHLLAAQIKKSGRYDYKVVEKTPEKCSIEFYGKGFLGSEGWSLMGTETYTSEDAKRAGLLNKSNWQKYPSDMLYARCIARGQRSYAPDAMAFTAYVPEEFDGALLNAPATGTYEGAVAVEAEVAPDVPNLEEIKASSEQNRGHGAENLVKAAEAPSQEDATTPETPSQGEQDPTPEQSTQPATVALYEPPSSPRKALMEVLVALADGDKEIAKLYLGRIAMDFFNRQLKTINDLTPDEALQCHRALTTNTYKFE